MSFLKKVRGGTVKKTSIYAEAAVRRDLLKSVMRNFAEFTRKHLCGNLFFDKVKLCKSATSLKKHLFSRTPPEDSSSINSSEGRIGKQNCKL